jgi:hypothetical protein
MLLINKIVFIKKKLRGMQVKVTWLLTMRDASEIFARCHLVLALQDPNLVFANALVEFCLHIDRAIVLGIGLGH